MPPDGARRGAGPRDRPVAGRAGRCSSAVAILGPGASALAAGAARRRARRRARRVPRSRDARRRPRCTWSRSGTSSPASRRGVDAPRPARAPAGRRRPGADPAGAPTTCPARPPRGRAADARRRAPLRASRPPATPIALGAHREAAAQYRARAPLRRGLDRGASADLSNAARTSATSPNGPRRLSRPHRQRLELTARARRRRPEGDALRWMSRGSPVPGSPGRGRAHGARGRARARAARARARARSGLLQHARRCVCSPTTTPRPWCGAEPPRSSSTERRRGGPRARA